MLRQSKDPDSSLRTLLQIAQRGNALNKALGKGLIFYDTKLESEFWNEHVYSAAGVDAPFCCVG